MKKVLLGACLVATSVVHAETLQSLSKDKVMSILSGNTLTTIPVITLNNQQSSNTWTGSFGADGKIQGKLADKAGDDPQQDTGTWGVDDDGATCITWDHWKAQDNLKTCIYLYEVNNGYILVSKEGTFQSALKKDTMQAGDKTGA